MDFPSWWGPEEGPPVRYPNEAAVPKGYVHFPGDYNVQTGQWVMPPSEKPQLDHDGKDGPGGSLPRNVPKLKSIAKAEGVDLGGATKADEIQALILAKRAG